ncbi:p21-activated protein kinase-interacting protein 1-like [Salvia splendens]|uniref:p21-activated protein kinase-interacting protein 1-like n=1 Tax=Salvia splendens TaxID=180675 RepID=UPI001C26070A|nr:p21-activated protein kinase-interacting protein 1-like [Salvia splendens]
MRKIEILYFNTYFHITNYVNDDCVKIYDLASSSEVGSFHHSASVTSVAFYSPPSLSSLLRNLLATDANGSVSIYDIDPFVLLKSVKIHKKSINSMSVHPSGKIALTVSHDQCMALVNLVRGRRSFYSKIGKEASLVQFDESGDERGRR